MGRSGSEAAVVALSRLALLVASAGLNGCALKYPVTLETAQLNTRSIAAEAASRITPQQLSECDQFGWGEWGMSIGNWKRTQPWTLSPRHTCAISELTEITKPTDGRRYAVYAAPYVPSSNPNAKPRYRICAFKITAERVELDNTPVIRKTPWANPCHHI
jgi:hypothetical protein